MKFVLLPGIFTLLFISLACSGDRPTFFEDHMQVLPFERWEEDSRYLNLGGDGPVLLLGSTRVEYPYLLIDAEAYLRELKDAGGNFVSCDLGAYYRKVSSTPVWKTADADPAAIKRDSIFWVKLRDFVGSASRKGFLTEIWVDIDSLQRQPDLTELESFNDRARASLEGFTNVYHLVNASRTSTFGLRVNTAAELNRQALKGRSVLWLDESSSDEALTYTSTYTAIRAIRNIERDFKFWDLTPAPEIMVNPFDQTATPAKDKLGNYLIHIAHPTTVKIKLDTEDQKSIRVTVIGYLGTRRSEILHPPYGSEFEISTEDEQGAWLLMQRI